MAKQVIGFEATFDGDKVEKSVKSIKTELREAQQEAINLARKFGDTSTEALEAAKKVANLRDEVGDFKDRVAALDPDKKFNAFSQSLQGVAGGFAGLQGAIGLFGTESKDLEKQLLKVQSALALSEGLNAILQSKDAFKNMGIVAVDAFKAIKGAIGATGIGLVLVALGTIYVYWEDIKGAVSGVSEEQKKLNNLSKTNLKTEQDKLDAIGSQDNILKLQGKSEKDILKIKIQQTDQVIKASEIQIQNQIITNKAAVEAAKRNKEILEGVIKFIATPLSLLLKTIDQVGLALGKDFGLEDKLFGGIAKMVFDPEATKVEGDNLLREQQKALVKLKNDRASFQLEIREIDKTASDNAKTASAAAQTEADKIQAEKDKKYLDDLKKKQELADYEKQVEADTIADLAAQDAAALQAENDRLTTDGKIKVSIAKATSDELIKNQKAEAEAKAAINSAYLDTLGQFGALLGAVAGKNKGVAIAGVIIEQASAIGRIISNTAVANAKAVAASPLTGGMPFVAINKISAGLGIASSIAAGAKAISQIKSAPGNSPEGGGNLPSGGGALPTQAPIASAVQVSQMQSVGTSSVNVANQSAVKAFVVERDITDSQDRISKIKSAATF